MDGPILEAAAALEPPDLRSLDAIHLATALALGPELDALVGYELSHDYQLRQWGWSERFRKLPPFNTSRSYLMGRNDKTETLRLLQAFDAGNRQLREEGALNALEERWLLSPQQAELSGETKRPE